MGVNFTLDIGEVIFNSNLEMSHLEELSKTIDGVKQKYEGTLSPCDVTSCSGAPDLRATCRTSVVWRDLTLGLTANYTGDYDNASVDYGGVKGDCEASAFASVYLYDDDSLYMLLTTPISTSASLRAPSSMTISRSLPTC